MARNIAEMTRLELPIEQVLEASLPDIATDPSLVAPDPTWLPGRARFEISGKVDPSEFMADLVLSTNGLSR